MGFLAHKAREISVRSTPVETKATRDDYFDDPEWTLVTGQRGDAPQSFRELVKRGFRQNPVVSAATRVIQNAVSDAPLRAQTLQSGEWKWVEPDHPAQEIVDVPNSRDSRIELAEKSVAHYLLGGNWFWEKRRSGTGRPRTLLPIRPDKIIKAIVDGDDIPLGFVLQEDDGSTRTIDAQNLIHVSDVDPWNEIFGLPRLLSASLEIRTDNEASDYVSEILTNHGQPGMIIGLDKNTRRRQLRRAEEFWDERFGPGKGRGKVAMIAGANQIKQIGFDLRMLEFPDLRIITRESICSVMGVDPILLAIGSASRGGTMSGNEHKEARVKMWLHTIIPLLRRWEAGLDRSLAADFGSGVRYRFDLTEVSALMEDRNKVMERAERMASTGAVAPEEIRAEMGLPEQPEHETIIQSVRTVVSPRERVFEADKVDDGMRDPISTGDENDDAGF